MGLAAAGSVCLSVGMDRTALLDAFNTQIRTSTADGGERHGPVIRFMSLKDGWNGVAWSNLTEDDADAVIAEQIAAYAEIARPWEWKHYSYDLPADLPERLLAAGFTAEPVEALLVAAVADLDLAVPVPDGIELREVRDQAGAADLVSVHDRVFGGDHSRVGRRILATLDDDPATSAAFVAYADGEPVSSARVDFHNGTDFASLWGGGTLPRWRRRGLFRALVSHRAALAAERGFTYLQVDAMPDSRPILKRLGFAELAMTTPYTHPGTA